LGLNLTSNKAGFIQHYGFMGVREATKVFLTHSRYNKSSTQRKRHPFKLKETGIFDNIYQESGAIDYLVNELSKTRTEALQVKLNELVLTLNKQTDGQK
jgi:ribosomal protein L24E